MALTVFYLLGGTIGIGTAFKSCGSRGFRGSPKFKLSSKLWRFSVLCCTIHELFLIATLGICIIAKHSDAFMLYPELHQSDSFKLIAFKCRVNAHFTVQGSHIRQAELMLLHHLCHYLTERAYHGRTEAGTQPAAMLLFTSGPSSAQRTCGS